MMDVKSNLDLELQHQRRQHFQPTTLMGIRLQFLFLCVWKASAPGRGWEMGLECSEMDVFPRAFDSRTHTQSLPSDLAYGVDLSSWYVLEKTTF